LFFFEQGASGSLLGLRRNPSLFFFFLAYMKKFL
jgi:hypothetical protein